jgi:hypothetical protein
MLQGLLPSGERSTDELDRALLDGRYCEIRMLFYVGKDILRWIEQCMEHVERQSFAAYLIHNTPAAVQSKLRRWGVADYKAIFTRALGLNAILTDVPDRYMLADEFVRNYYRYADQMFVCRQGQTQFADLSDFGFEFEIYASGEYSRLLEREWAES